ncbi:MAG: hypothetical protein IJ849_01555 [Selenomonadaceae bacterium]|nr:hypothetical protein [Selenomonadaceae bacterium]
MFDELDEVIIKASGKIGTIVDKHYVNGYVEYIVEEHEWQNGEYPLRHCTDADLAAMLSTDKAA